MDFYKMLFLKILRTNYSHFSFPLYRKVPKIKVHEDYHLSLPLVERHLSYTGCVSESGDFKKS